VHLCEEEKGFHFLEKRGSQGKGLLRGGAGSKRLLIVPRNRRCVFKGRSRGIDPASSKSLFRGGGKGLTEGRGKKVLLKSPTKRTARCSVEKKGKGAFSDLKKREESGGRSEGKGWVE